jgi:hypothetical protein
MIAKSERLAVLSEAEQYAQYGLPDLDDAQQREYLGLSETELALAVSRPGPPCPGLLPLADRLLQGQERPAVYWILRRR